MKYKFTANAVRWFDKANGNTYHSVRITNNETGEVLYCQFQYGYGDNYRQTALTDMGKAGWIPEEYSTDFNGKQKTVFMYERENGYPISWIVSDGLKRDCIANGKA
jgi:hypothetical protein